MNKKMLGTPTPMNISVDEVQLADSRKQIVLTFESPTGVFVAYLDPGTATEVATILAAATKKAKSRLILPVGAL